MSDQPDAKIIRSSSLGEELNDKECQTLAGLMRVQPLKDNQQLVGEGENDNALFLLAKGKLAVLSRVEEQDVVVYRMKVGECAGTRAFVDRTARKATLRSIGDSVVYSLKPADFESLLESDPHLVYTVMRALFRITHANLMRMNQESQQLSNYISKTHGRY
ncbi:MAG: Crp/Fnr family transcriptional regulator [Gammaproteobacteria bacterium]|nr:MAG: Crp/Fnr family transcriptional regulator [Gammaproteobacteria bacterium]